MSAALTSARALMRSQPERAEEQAEALLRTMPGHPESLLILGVAHRQQGKLFEALALLKPLARSQPDYADAHYEWGVTQAALGLIQPAIASLRRAVALDSQTPAAWQLLGDLLLTSGEPAMADAAFIQQVRHAQADPVLRQAAEAVDTNDLKRAERLLRARLAETPHDVAALRMLSDIRLHLGDNVEAENFSGRCLALSPNLTPARITYVAALLHQGHAQTAQPHLAHLLAAHPIDPQTLILQASLLAMTGERVKAIDLYRTVLRDHPQGPNTWLRLGHVLRTSGRANEALEAYRQAVTLAPSLGDAYWSLANLKVAVFTPTDIAAMQAQSERPDISDEDRIGLHYALGSALERNFDYAASFAQYAAGAQLQRRYLDYDANRTTASAERSRALMNQAFFAMRINGGNPDAAPIFVVGLPRSGTTLVEQILATHSLVEGTSELRTLGVISAELGWDRDDNTYAANLATLTEGERLALGQLYIDRTRQHRRTDRPFFIDKMPDNFAHTGLIHLILPNAKIIDVRRRPMAACFSAFKQLFARGTVFSYDLRELGLYYRNYVALMAHFDAVLPERVHRILYEHLIDNTELEIRRVLDYCHLNFEPACLRFHETRRDITTASSEQVRKPIFREALDHWRNYEPWLGDLRAALGDLADAPNLS